MATEQRRQWREKARRALEKYFSRHSYPRLVFTLVLVLAGIAGLGISFGLLHGGVEHMWVRYPAAVVGAYLCCLAMLRLWAALEHRRFDARKLVTPHPVPSVGSRSSGPWLDNLGRLFDPGSAVDLAGDGEGCVVGCLLTIILGGLAFIFVTLIGSASTLLAEIFLDAFFISALYRRLRVAALHHWLGTALRRTWLHVLGVAFLLSLLGALLEHYAPTANTIGEALRQIFAR